MCPGHCSRFGAGNLGTSGFAYDEWAQRDFGHTCAKCAYLWDQYRWLGGVAQQSGTRIFNATAGGVLDLYAREARPPE